jgi:hypothetical protein
VKKVKFEKGQAMLSPLRFHYDSKDFSLPVRLGLLNAKGKQDLIVHILAQNQRYEVANYKNVTVPTNLVISTSVKKRFAEFYAALFDDTIKRNKGAVVTEYAWQSTKCDPCPAGNFGNAQLGGPLDYNDLQMLGLDVVSNPKKHYRFYFNEDTRVVESPDDKSLARLRSLLFTQAHGCLNDELPTSTQPIYGNFVIKARISDKGELVHSVTDNNRQPQSQALAKCIDTKLKQLSIAQSGAVEVQSTLNLQSSMYVENQWQLTQNWVLTRLHARYSAQELKSDLVFKATKPIVGGRGMPQGKDGTIYEQQAQVSSVNNFQGRYIMLQPWKGAITCKNPRRGVWGYPPSGNTAQPAQDLAFVPRGKFKLQSSVRSKDVPGLPWTKKN